MVDTKKYEKIYQEILKLQPDDTLELQLEAKTDDEIEFYKNVNREGIKVYEQRDE